LEARPLYRYAGLPNACTCFRVPALGGPHYAGCHDARPTISQESNLMNVHIKIPTSLRKFVGGNDTIRVASTNVREALDQLDSHHPGIKAKLCDGDGNLRRFINIYADQEDIRFLDNLDTLLGDGSELQIVPAIAGGQ
jgi:sulfur-carrier protein